jgi:hypothetical protein
MGMHASCLTLTPVIKLSTRSAPVSEKSNQPHDAGAGHATSLRHVFRERAISLHTMEPRLRLMTGLALAQLFAVVVLIALSHTLVTAQVPVS